MPSNVTGSLLDWANLFLERHNLKRYLPYSGDLQARRKNFYALGDVFLKIFIETGGLKPDERVLDIGCGPGRMAGPHRVRAPQVGGHLALEGLDVLAEYVSAARQHGLHGRIGLGRCPQVLAADVHHRDRVCQCITPSGLTCPAGR